MQSLYFLKAIYNRGFLASLLVTVLIGIPAAPLASEAFSVDAIYPGSPPAVTRGTIPLLAFRPLRATADDRDADSPHVLAASYYSFRGGVAATLTLNHKGPDPLDVKPTFYNLAGERLDVASLRLEPNSFRVIDIRELAAAGGPSFQEGSLQLFYRGRNLLLGAQVKLVDTDLSLIYDEQLLEPAVKFASPRLEGVWSVPARDSQVELVISNTTDAPVSASVALDGIAPKQKEPAVINLQPHQTQVLDLRRDFFEGGPLTLQNEGGISIQHSGSKGAVLANVVIQNPSIGYSSKVHLSDPQMGKSSRVHGGGLRLGKVAGERLTPVVVARNVGAATTLLTGRIPYTTADGAAGVAPIKEVKLQPGESKLINLTPALSQTPIESVATAGLEFEYSTEPGSVIMSALSRTRGGNQVFHVPMLDPAAQKSSTGGYPWFIDEDSSTTIYIKNTTDATQQYVAHLSSTGGTYMFGLSTIEPHQTVAIDVRALRDNRVPDEKGNLIPTDATGGQLKWTLIQGEDPNDLVLIGRAEQADVVKAISSSYACASCCADSFYDGYVSPFGVEADADQVVDFDAIQVNEDCYGNIYSFSRGASWSSSNNSVATVDGTGTATAVSAGSTTLTASWSARIYASPGGPCGPYYYSLQSQIQPNLAPCGGCSSALVYARPTASFAVRPKINSLSPNFGPPATTVQVTISGKGFGTSPSVQVSGAGVTVAINSISNTQLSVSFTIDPGATAGNRNVTVTSNGKTSSSKTFEVRVPDHLVVVADTNAQLSCPVGAPVIRMITFQVVNSNGNPVGVVPVQEIFNNVSTNTCRSDGRGPNPSGCMNTDGNTSNFTDNVTVNCNAVNGACGYSITWQWQWCPQGGTVKTLGTLSGTVHANQITINNNSTGFSQGTVIRP